MAVEFAGVKLPLDFTSEEGTEFTLLASGIRYKMGVAKVYGFGMYADKNALNAKVSADRANFDSKKANSKKNYAELRQWLENSGVTMTMRLIMMRDVAKDTMVEAVNSELKKQMQEIAAPGGQFEKDSQLLGSAFPENCKTSQQLEFVCGANTFSVLSDGQKLKDFSDAQYLSLGFKRIYIQADLVYGLEKALGNKLAEF